MLILITGIISKAVLLVLVGLSIWSIAIIKDRLGVLNKISEADSFDDLKMKIASQNFTEIKKTTHGIGLRANTLRIALETNSNDSEKIDRSVRSYLNAEKSRLENGFTTLATLGSNAPFIGLFGTVLGIIQAFASLTNQKADTASVMTGISEALIATAIGLFVAIPAVIAYNVLTRKLKVLLIECDSLKDEFIAKQTSSRNAG